MIRGELMGIMAVMNRSPFVGCGLGVLALWVAVATAPAPRAVAAEGQNAPAQNAPAQNAPAPSVPAPSGSPDGASPNTPEDATKPQPSQGQAPAGRPVEMPLKPPPMAEEPVRIWQPEGMGEPSPSSRPLPRRVPRTTALPIQQPGTSPPGALAPGAMRPGMMRPGMMPPGALPPGVSQRGGIPPGALPPGAMPPGAMPPGAMPPGVASPGASQQPKAAAKTSTWSPWTSLGLGLLVAGGVTWAVTSSRKRNDGFDADFADLGGRGDDRRPRG